MLKNLNGIKVNYYFCDSGSNETMVLLHGWGQNIEMMMPIGDKFNKNYNILIIDLPGFGKSSEPNYSWEVIDYVECVKKIVDDLELKNIILIGHSFGGRISLLYSSKYNVKKLICLASPYCKEITKLSFETKLYKKLKTIPGLKWISSIMRNRLGSTDYKNASEIMKGVLVKSINLEMVDDIKKINCPALLIWGSSDTAVPVKRAYELNELIKDSKVVVYDNATHYAYLERLNEVVKEIKDFIRK